MHSEQKTKNLLINVATSLIEYAHSTPITAEEYDKLGKFYGESRSSQKSFLPKLLSVVSVVGVSGVLYMAARFF